MIGPRGREPIDARGLGRVVDRVDWSAHRIAVIGDIHGNVTALDVALEAIAARGVATVVCHGDLLTYGCHPVEVLERVDEMLQRFDCLLLVGNHDEFYSAGPAGEPAAAERGFIAESIAWTREQIGIVDLSARFPWADTGTVDSVLFSHANPFDRPSWSYLVDPEAERVAAGVLDDRGARVGVFGHTHRPRLTAVTGDRVERHDVSAILDAGPDGDRRWVLNTGSVGQPRGEGSSWLELDLGAATATATVHRLDYDVGPHLDAITASGLSAPTVERLVSFFTPAESAP